VCSFDRQRSQESWWRFFSENHFSILLVILIGLLVGPSFFEILGRETKWYAVLMNLLMLAAIFSLCFETYQRWFAILLGVPTIFFALIGHLLTGSLSASSLLLTQICEIVFFLGAAILIVRSLFGRREVSFDSILGAVCGYIFLGLGWAVCYSIIESFHPGSFALGPSIVRPSGDRPMLPQLLIYYSFITLTTVGYGDIIPVAPAARSLAWMEAITGQFYLAVIVAALVTLITAKHGHSNSGN